MRWSTQKVLNASLTKKERKKEMEVIVDANSSFAQRKAACACVVTDSDSESGKKTRRLMNTNRNRPDGVKLKKGTGGLSSLVPNNLSIIIMSALN